MAFNIDYNETRLRVNSHGNGSMKQYYGEVDAHTHTDNVNMLMFSSYLAFYHSKSTNTTE